MALGICAYFVVTSILWYVAWRRNPKIAAEHHLLEWVQAAALIVAAALFINSWRRAANVVDRFAWFGLGLVCLTIAMRELAIRRLVADPIGNILHQSIRGLSVAAWVGYFIIAAGHRRVLVTGFVAFCRSSNGRLAIAGGVFFFAGWPFDRLKYTLLGLSSVFVEEMLEFHASMLLLLAGVRVPVRRPVTTKAGEATSGIADAPVCPEVALPSSAELAEPVRGSKA